MMKKLISKNKQNKHRHSNDVTIKNDYNSIDGANNLAEMHPTNTMEYHSTDCSQNALNSAKINKLQQLTPTTPNQSASYIVDARRVPFYSSGMGLTLSYQRRAWVDPWEANPSERFLVESNANPNMFDLKSSENIVSSIHPSEQNNILSILQQGNITPMDTHTPLTGNGEEFKSMSHLYNNVGPNLYNNPKRLPMESKQSYDIDLIENGQSGQLDPILSRKNSAKTPNKFGAWDGVMAGCLLNIFGVIMFLRVGWIVGQCGILSTFGIMAISSAVTTLTAISMSAICTNGTILAGGAYYIISRTLGPAFGGSVGILLSFGNMVACSMYLTGFAETLVDNLQDGVLANNFSITGDPINDCRIWSNVVLVIVLILALVGLKWVIKAQIGLLLFICCAIVLFFIGSFYQTEENILYGIDGWSNGNLKENLLPDFKQGYNFWSVLAIFFPAVTGIMAGANISGDLRNPSQDIPQGTLTAVGVSSVVYMLMALFVGAVAERSALIDNPLLMADICVWDYIVFIGIYSATLSSAIASLVGAPRILMAIAQDNIIAIPGIAYFAETDESGNPIRGYFLSFTVAFGFNCVGELNLIAPLISQFFIIVYLIINFASFVMEISHSPGWRPSFYYFNRYTGLLGSALCLTIMFLLDWAYALATTSIAFALYLFISWKDPGVSWGGVFDTRAIYTAYEYVLNLGLNKKKINDMSSVNWRPSFLLIHLNTKKDIHSMETDCVTLFVETLQKGYGLIFAVDIIVGEYRSQLLKTELNSGKSSASRSSRRLKGDGYLPIRKHVSSHMKFVGKRVNGFCNNIIADTYRKGVQNALQMCGLGVLTPNTMVIKMKDESIDISDDEYVEIIRDALLTGCGVMICCSFDKINFDLPQFSIVNDNNVKYHNIIDIWWMVDDGGLILLLPYIMCLHKFFRNCRVRINLITDNDTNSTFYEEHIIKELIKKFRLHKIYDDQPRIIHVVNNDISAQTIKTFEEYSNCKITSTTRQKVICRWLRLCELLYQYSNQSSMIIVTLPIPTTFTTPQQYMAILKIMGDRRKLPPVIIMRGNGQQTLTFHSE